MQRNFRTYSVFVAISSTVCLGLIAGCAEHLRVGTTDATGGTGGGTQSTTTVDGNATTSTMGGGGNGSTCFSAVPQVVVSASEVAAKPHYALAIPTSNGLFGAQIATDPAGQLVVAGWSNDPTIVGVSALPAGVFDEGFVGKLANDGSWMFHTPLADVFAEALAVTATGDIYVVGQDLHTAIFTPADPSQGWPITSAYRLVHVSPTGEVLWDTSYDPGPGNRATAQALATAADGTVWATGFLAPSSGPNMTIDQRFLLAHYDSSGNELFKTVVSHSGTETSWGTSLVILGNGDVLVAGGFSGSLDFGGGTSPLSAPTPMGTGFVARFSSAGAAIQSKVVQSSFSEVWLALGPGGNIYLAADGPDPSSQPSSVLGCDIPTNVIRGFVAGLDDTLTAQWVRQLGPSSLGYGTSAVLAVDAHGNIAAVPQGSADPGEYLKTLAAGGSTLRTYRASRGTSAQALYPTAGSVVMNSAGTIFTSGAFRTSIDFGFGTLKTPGQAAYIVALTP